MRKLYFLISPGRGTKLVVGMSTSRSVFKRLFLKAPGCENADRSLNGYTKTASF